MVEQGTGGGGTTAATSTTAASTGSDTTTGPSTSSAVATSSGSGTDCGALTEAYLEALSAAQQCNACQDFDACIGGPDLPDQCGCPVPLNGQTIDLLENAKARYAEWSGAGCGPLECGQPCNTATTGFCAGTGSGCLGVCSY